jgi:hypothetical protein
MARILMEHGKRNMKDKTLHDRLKAIADEYAAQMGDVIGCELQYWVADGMCIDIADFGDNYFFSLAEMQEVIDHLPRWIERYGTKEEVGEVVREYMDTLVENEDKTFENGHPRINLWSWMKGLRWESLPPAPSQGGG